ncbi:MAG TPA: GNAT family N-acetyltransferase [Rhizomicrobium sp.]|jgi:GNAT superfamily N-acetyltransferase|nr:GNAT family N-acetyltransferase [Rhizomicrobium sp.]
MTAPIVEKLRSDHIVEGFDCGKEPLNRFLIRHALQAQLSNASQTYVAAEERCVVGYHTLVVGEVECDRAPDRLRKGMARHPVPLMVLPRLGVRADRQECGLGSGLLKDALLRTANAADIAGIRAIAVHAKDDGARVFYEHFNFQASPTAPLHLFLLLKDIRTLIK